MVRLIAHSLHGHGCDGRAGSKSAAGGHKAGRCQRREGHGGKGRQRPHEVVSQIIAPKFHCKTAELRASIMAPEVDIHTVGTEPVFFRDGQSSVAKA